MHPRSRSVLATSLAVVNAAALVILLPAPASAAAGLPPSEWVLGPRSRVVFITFDGMAGPRKVRSVLRTLDHKNAKASFFFSGAWVERHRRLARRVSNGHGLGNRGYGSKPFTRLDSTALRASIARAHAVLTGIGASPRPFLRAPQGKRDLRVLEGAGSLGYRSLRWSVAPGGGGSRRVARRVLKRTRPGGIVKLDIWRRSHRRALPRIVDGLRRRDIRIGRMRRIANAHPIRWDVTLRAGSSGGEVSFLQKILRGRTYPAGRVDGGFGYKTQQAVYAFEKVNGLRRDGVVTPQQMTRTVLSRRPWVRKLGLRTMINVDISRQVVFEVRRGRVVHTTPMSSGNEEYYTVDGETYKAHTPRGHFRIERKIPGERHSRLGTLYNPLYFVGGYALHGSKSVPTYPASHGCIRLPMYVSRPFYDRNPIGTYVYIHN